MTVSFSSCKVVKSDGQNIQYQYRSYPLKSKSYLQDFECLQNCHVRRYLFTHHTKNDHTMNLLCGTLPYIDEICRGRKIRSIRIIQTSRFFQKFKKRQTPDLQTLMPLQRNCVKPKQENQHVNVCSFFRNCKLHYILFSNNRELSSIYNKIRLSKN